MNTSPTLLLVIIVALSALSCGADRDLGTDDIFGLDDALFGDNETLGLGDDLFGLGGDMGLTGKDAQCFEDTQELAMNSNALLQATLDYAMAMDSPDDDTLIEESPPSSMTMGYPQDAVDSLRTICEQAGGRLLVMKEGSFDCAMDDGETISLTLQNVANCLAATEDCKDFPQEHLMTSIWEMFGMECVKNDPPEESKNAKPAWTIFLAAAGIAIVVGIVAFDHFRGRRSEIFKEQGYQLPELELKEDEEFTAKPIV
jgi:hypothetical protein